MITVTDIETASVNNKSYISASLFITTPPPEPSPFPHAKYLTDITYEDKLALETGYAARNEWLEWMMYTAQQNNQSNCIACA